MGICQYFNALMLVFISLFFFLIPGVTVVHELSDLNICSQCITRRQVHGYSKTLDNHKHAVALFVWHFNFCRIHSAHGRTPAQECGLVSQAFTVEDLMSATI
jgi:hypothetical protein